jgi:hypothetical protein
MRCLVVVALAVACVAGCGADCAKSADIQVTVVPNADVDTARLARLHVILSIDDGAPHWIDISLDHTLSSSGSAFILKPDPPPKSKYPISVTVQALDAGGDLLAIGSDRQDVVDNGCNRMAVQLAGLPGPSTDMAGMLPIDMAGCIGALPDEDLDGRANFCDLCPADYDPTPIDGDGDGLPDACDPDPGTASNTLVYFEPFDSANPRWSGGNLVQSSYLLLDAGTSGVALSSNATDTLPLNVRMQAMVVPYQYDPAATDIDTGIFVGTGPNPSAPGSYGALCILNSISMRLEIYKVQNGTLLSGMGSALQISGNKYRMRLTQRGSNWTCEALVNGTSVTVSTTQAVTAPLYMALRSAGSSNRFLSVVAETSLP